MEQLMTVHEVAECLRVSPNTVRRWIKEGRLRGHQIAGTTWRISTKDVLELIETVEAAK